MVSLKLAQHMYKGETWSSELVCIELSQIKLGHQANRLDCTFPHQPYPKLPSYFDFSAHHCPVWLNSSGYLKTKYIILTVLKWQFSEKPLLCRWLPSFYLGDSVGNVAHLEDPCTWILKTMVFSPCDWHHAAFRSVSSQQVAASGLIVLTWKD